MSTIVKIEFNFKGYTKDCYLYTMDSPTEQQPINIYLSRTEKTNLSKTTDNSSNASQAYIIASHDKMLRDYNRIKEDLSIMTAERDMLEEENERMEKSLTNLKGFVKNLALMNGLNKTLVKKYTKYQNDTYILLVEQYELVFHLIHDVMMELLLLFLIYISLWYFGFISFLDVVGVAMFKGTITAYKWTFYKTKVQHIKNIRSPPKIEDTKFHNIRKKNMNSIDEKLGEIKELESGNAFLSDPLNELIDVQ